MVTVSEIDTYKQYVKGKATMPVEQAERIEAWIKEHDKQTKDLKTMRKRFADWAKS